jgi:hypothetical protein
MQLLPELLIVHGDVAGGVAKVGMLGKERLVALLHDVELRVVELGKMLVT